MSQNHLVPLNAEGWSLWKWFQLRSGGFAADGALALGSTAVDECLSRLFAAEQELAATRLRAKERLDELAVSDDAELARSAKQTRSRLYKNKSLAPLADTQFDAALAAYAAAMSALNKQEKAIEVALEQEKMRASKALRTYAEMPLFREAIAWQNRDVLGRAIDGYLRAEVSADNTKARDRQRLLAKYIQRYTLKNDTIGFFGPTAWGEFDATCAGFDLEPGPVIARRAAFFEYWMVGSFVEQLDQHPEVLPIASLRLRLGSWVSGREHVTRDGTRTELSELQSGILGLASSTETVAAIASRIVEQGLAGSEEAVFDKVRELVRAQLATAKIEVPTEICRPEKWLRGLVEQLPSSALREETLATLDLLDARLQGVADAGGDVEALCAAIDKLEHAFRDTTAIAAKRGHGQVYAGRQIFYEECVRGGDLRIGRSFIESLASPLGLVLKSTRWFTYQIGRRYRAAFSSLYKELTANGAGTQVPLMSFQIASRRFFQDDPAEASDIIAKVQTELRRRWEQVLQLEGSSASRIAIRSEDCAARVDELFAAPGPGWPLARYQAPDLMLAASSAEAVSRGDFEAVLGELHCGTNTILMMAPFSLHPERDEIARASAGDLMQPAISPVLTMANRVMAGAIAPNAIDLEDKASRSWRSRSQVLVGGDLFVEEQDGALEVVSRTTGERYDIMRFMDYQLSHAAASHFSLLPRKPHMARVTIDNLIVSRERWTFTRADFAELIGGKRTPTERFIALSKWVRERGLPRFVFAVFSNEPKPVYVDFASATLASVMLNFLEKATKLSLSEMLPGHGQHWLECDQGAHYASELRFIALDPVAWAPGMA